MMIAYMVNAGKSDDYDRETEFYLFDNKETAFNKYAELCEKEKDDMIRYAHYVKEEFDDDNYPTDEEENEMFNKSMNEMKNRWNEYNETNDFNEISYNPTDALKIRENKNTLKHKDGRDFGVPWSAVGLAIVKIGNEG